MNQEMNNIHRNAKIGRDVQVGPFTTIEEDVVIGPNIWGVPEAPCFNNFFLVIMISWILNVTNVMCVDKQNVFGTD